MQRRVVPDVVRGQDLLTPPATATVREAAIRMTDRGVRSVLVMNRYGLVGIFTGADLIERVVAIGRNPEATPLKAAMTKRPATVPPDSLAIEALRLMQAGRFRHLPVVEGRRLVGIVSRRDFLADEEDEIEREQRIWERI